MVVVPLSLSLLNSLNRVLYISSNPVWFSFCLKWQANLLLPDLCDLQSDLLSGFRDTSSCQRIGVKALCRTEFWGVSFNHLSQIEEATALSAVPGKHCPEIRLKITLESALPFQRAYFSLVFLGLCGEFSHGVFALLSSSKNTWKLDWPLFNKTVTVMVSAPMFTHRTLCIISLRIFLPDCCLRSF